MFIKPGLFIILFLSCSSIFCQQLTGIWKGKINNSRVELKLVQNGDSITGTSYYHGLLNNHRRYSIKGYFDPYSNSVVWWDDQLISNKGANAGEKEMFSVADFDCPGGDRMYLDGKTIPKGEKGKPKSIVSLTKVGRTSFNDEWDFIIDTYTEGGNNKKLIDSISRVALNKKSEPKKDAVAKQTAPAIITAPVIIPKKVLIKKQEQTPVLVVKTSQPKPLSIDEMFNSRKKVFNTEIPIKGDSIELRFYDNAEVDGDSISLYLNNRMIFTNVRLSANAYIIKLALSQLNDDNELVMVAENLGAIPPNTSYMVAIVGDKRYDAQLESTENSSSLIRLKKIPTDLSTGK